MSGDPVPLLEREPAVATQLFNAQLDKARRFVVELAGQGVTRGLIGPVECERLWTRHIINSVLLAPLLRVGRVGDVGSGAGLPGLVLAIARPDVEFILIEPMERRVDWLHEMVEALSLPNVEVVRARAEEARLVPPLDQVTARAVSSLTKLIPLTAPLVRSGGELLFLKGVNVANEVEAASKAIRKSNLVNVEVLTLGDELSTEATRVFRATVG